MLRKAFEYHTFLHHSQTRNIIEKHLQQFEYHTFLHHSQTERDQSISILLFEYHTFYIILKHWATFYRS